MNFTFLLVAWIGYLPMSSNDNYLEQVRANYVAAAQNSKLCNKMIQELSNTRKDPVLLAYLGGFKAIWAKHTINPFGKLSTFKEGKILIEKAVKDDPNNIEVRFVRLSVQKNCPFFLGYKQNIKEDVKFINSAKNTINSIQLSAMLETIK